MPSRALVLGGGGPIGIGWESGLAAGLERKGVSLADADLIVGTSAGSIVGAQLALGRSPAELVAVQLALNDREQPALDRMKVDTAALIANFGRWLTSDRPPEELRAELGAFALSAKTMSEDEWLATFGQLRQVGIDRWPVQFVCTAVDTADGSFATWDKDSGVELGRAVASSCAVPGIYPPVTIKGHRYMDGGMRSGTNADVARGYDSVLVVSVTGGVASRTPMAERARLRLEGDLDALRESGSAVELVLPDAASLEAFGPNLLDASRRRAAAEHGLRQGQDEAARIQGFWG